MERNVVTVGRTLWALAALALMLGGDAATGVMLLGALACWIWWREHPDPRVR